MLLYYVVFLKVLKLLLFNETDIFQWGCEDESISSSVITEVKLLELNQFSDGSNLMGATFKEKQRKTTVKKHWLRISPAVWLVERIQATYFKIKRANQDKACQNNPTNI